MEKDLYHGNGKPGITTRLELLEESVKEFKKGQDRITWLIISAVILALLNMVIRR
jgi:coenzyme F420-reducing hydrogenase delta subunit